MLTYGMQQAMMNIGDSLANSPCNSQLSTSGGSYLQDAFCYPNGGTTYSGPEQWAVPVAQQVQYDFTEIKRLLEEITAKNTPPLSAKPIVTDTQPEEDPGPAKRRICLDDEGF
jgi:hypothetical protein